MISKKHSKAKRIALCILLAVVVVMFTSQSASAQEPMPVEQTESTSVDYQARVFACCQFWFSFHFGITIVDSEWFKAIYYNIIVNFEIRCWYYWALVMEMGYNSFKWDPDVVDVEENFYIWNVNMTLRRYFGKDRFRPFINFGPGLYSPKLGTPRPGFKAGLGVDIQISDRVYIEFGSDYHHMFLKDEDLYYVFTGKKFFFHAHGGIVIRLK